MRVKWNRQLDGSLLARRQAEQEEEEARNRLEGKEHKQQEGKEHKHKESPKLFRLFRRKKRRAPVPPGDLPGPPYAPSEADEDDCASISSVATVASQPTAEVCHRDRTMSIFSSFRLNFPGSKKKSKRTVASNDPVLKEPSRYSSPDLRRERLDGPCGGQLSSSSPSVKDAVPRKQNEDLLKHSSTNCFVKAAQQDLGGQMSKSSPSVENSAVGFSHPFIYVKQSSVKQKITRDKLGDSQIEMSKSTPSVKVSSSGFGEIGNSFTHLEQYIHQETKNKMNLHSDLTEVSSVEEFVTDLQNSVLKHSGAIDTNLYDHQNNWSKSISFVMDTARSDLKSLERLRLENSNSLDQLKRGDPDRCAQKNMRSAKSVSFFEDSLSPSDVTCVAEAGVFPTVNGQIEEATQRKSTAHSAEPSCRGKSTSDDFAEPFHAVSGGSGIEKAALFVAPNESACGKKNVPCRSNMKNGDFGVRSEDLKCHLTSVKNDPCHANMKNGDFYSGGIIGVCSEDLKLHSASVKCDSEYDEFRFEVCDQHRMISDLGAKISQSEVPNGAVCVDDLQLRSSNFKFSNEKFMDVCDRPVHLGNVLSEGTRDEVNTTLKPILESMQTKDSTNLSNSSCAVNDGIGQATKYVEQPVFEHRNDFNLNDLSKQIDSAAINVNVFSVSNDVNVESCDSSFTRELSKHIIHDVKTSTKEDFNISNVNSNVLLSGKDPAIENNSQFSNTLLEIQSNNCDADVMPNTQLLQEPSECHNHPNLHILNCDADFSTDIYVTQAKNNLSLKKSISQCLNNLNTDYSNVSDSFVQLGLFCADDLIFEYDIYSTEIKKKSVLHSKPSEIQLDFIRNNAFGSYLSKLTETGTFSGNYFDSSTQVKSIWNASLVQTIISRQFPDEEWLFDPYTDSMYLGPPFVATIREKNPIVPERCPDLSSAPVPTTVTVADRDLHTDTPRYFVGGGSAQEDNTEMIPNVEKTSFRPFSDVPNVCCTDGDIYDERLISVKRCDDCVESDAESTLRKCDDCIKNDDESTHHSNEINILLSEKCSAIELDASIGYVSEQKCTRILSPSSNDSSVHFRGNFNDDNCASDNSQVHLCADGLEMRLDVSNSNSTFIDSLPGEKNVSDYITLKNGFPCESEKGSSSTKVKIGTWSDTTSKFSAAEIGNNCDVADSKVAYGGVKNKIKMFESGASDVSSENTHLKNAITSSNKVELNQKKNLEKGKISMIPSLRKGIPTAIKNTPSKSSKGKSQIQKNKIKDIPQIISRKAPNESQLRPIKSQSNKNFSNESQVETKFHSLSPSCKVHDKSLDLKSDCSQPDILIAKPSVQTDLPSTCAIPEKESGTAPELSERSKSEELLLDAIPNFPESNPNTSVRRHSSAAVFEPTTDFFQTIANCSETAQMAPSHFNLTLEEVSLSLLEEKSSSSGLPVEKTRSLQSRSASLPLVIGQVQQAPAAAATRNNSVIKDGRRGSTRTGIPTKHAGRVSSHLSTSKQPARPTAWLSKAELTQEIQRLGTLCEARTKELNRLKMETKHVTVGFDAFAALFKYMVEDVNGLSVPKLSEELGKTLKQLELAKQDLAYYEREVEEMKAHHCQELNDLSNKLFEVFQGEVTELGTKHQEEVNRLKQEHELQLQATSEMYKVGSEETQACHEAAVMKLQQELITQSEELQLFHEKELLELEQKHCESTKTLQEHIEQLQKKCAELKHHSLGMEDAMRKDTDTKLQWVTSRKGDLEKEVESLKAVLEMKNKELHTIRVQNLEMQKQMEDLPLAREKIKMLSARAEDLEALMAEKTRLERKLSTENQTIRDTYEKESKVNKRLSMENEELQWRLRQAEQSIISGSFTEVAESAEEMENCPLSPVKSPPQMSRSVFFTFVDKDNSSPRSQYKKITPGFSSGYKTSPSKSSAPSPRRGRGLSEPLQPSGSTPKKTTLKQQKRQRAGTSDNGGAQSFASSMVSSVGSESSVFDQREELLEEHKEQIMETLEILREQRCSEENDGELTPCRDIPEQNGRRPVTEEDCFGDVPCQEDGEVEYPDGLIEQQVSLKQNGDSGVLDENPSLSNRNGERSDSKTTWHDVRQNGGEFVLDVGPESPEGLEQPVASDEEKMCFPEEINENGSDAMTPSDKWQEEVAKRIAFDGDEMSRSAEFSDPKTYYHMTFPVLKEAGAQDCDPEDATKDGFATAQATHSMVESSEVVRHATQAPKEASLGAAFVSLQENGASTAIGKVLQQHALSQSCHSTENVQDSECKERSREKNRWRTM